MKNRFLLIASLIASSFQTISAQAPDWLWAKRATGQYSNNSSSITSDSSGNVYVAGYFYGDTLQFDSMTLLNPYGNNGYTNSFITKYDTSGNILWVKAIQGNGNNITTSIACDRTGNIYIAGYFHSAAISFGSIIL